MCHSRPGQNDEMNTASLFAVSEVIKLHQARIVTIEETYGLVCKQDSRQYFSALINMLTSLNFSVRWSIVPLVEYGLAQTRRRLIIITSW